jgi:hypothetical protein
MAGFFCPKNILNNLLCNRVAKTTTFALCFISHE